MAIPTIQRRNITFYKLSPKFTFLHDLQTHKEKRSDEKKNKEWVCDEARLLPRLVQRKLKRLLEKERDEAKQKGVKKFRVKDYMLIDLDLQSGLRVEEMSDLEIRDLYLNDIVTPFIHVRHGKNDKARKVLIPKELVKHLKEYLKWKTKIGEPMNETSPLFYSIRRGKFTTMALQKSFDRWIKKVTTRHHSIHDLRHTYASELLVASNGDFLFVSRQLGHENVMTTMKYYSHVIREHAIKSLRKLYK